MTKKTSHIHTRRHNKKDTFVFIVSILAIATGQAAGSEVDTLRGGSLRVSTHSRYSKKHHRKPKAQARHNGEASLSFLNEADLSQQPSSNLHPSTHPILHVPSLRTDVADLTCHFETAIQAINLEDKDIHVGNLLNACDQLEETMKKIGFNQGAKDIAGNIRKIRNLYRTAPPSIRDDMPTLLRYEMELGVHDEPDGTRKIKDPSAAVGFLWLGRTLNYQYDMFQFMLNENADPYNAARQAYDQDLKHHQSWAVQKICQTAMKSLKPMKRSSILSRFGGFDEERFGETESDAINRDLHQLMNCWQPLIAKWKKVITDLELGVSI